MAGANTVEVVATVRSDQYEAGVDRIVAKTRAGGAAIADSFKEAGDQLGLFEQRAGRQLELPGVKGAGAAPAIPAIPAVAANEAWSMAGAIKEMRVEGRQAMFLGRMMSEIGIASGGAARGIGLVALGLAGTVGPLLAIEGAVIGVGLLREKFEELHKAQEEAARRAREFGLALRSAITDADSAWEKFRSGFTDQHLSAAQRLANEQMRDLAKEAEKAQRAAEAAMDALGKKLPKTVPSVAELGITRFDEPAVPLPERVPVGLLGAGRLEGIDAGAAPADVLAKLIGPAQMEELKKKGNEAGLAAAVAFIAKFQEQVETAFALRDTAGVNEDFKKLGTEAADAFKKALESNVKSAQIGAGLSGGKAAEFAGKELEIQRQINGERMRFAGEELRLATERRDKLAALDKDIAGGKYGPQGPTLRQATEQAANLAIQQARQKHEQELRALSTKYADVTATERAKIAKRADDEIAAIEAQRKLVEKVDPKRGDQLQQEIGLRNQIKTATLAEFDAQRQITQAAEQRTAQSKIEEVSADTIQKARIQGTTELLALEDKLAAAKRKQGTDAAAEVAHLQNQIGLQQTLNDLRLRVAVAEQAQSRNSDLRSLRGQIEDVTATDEDRIRLQGLREIQALEDRAAAAREKGNLSDEGHLQNLIAGRRVLTDLESRAYRVRLGMAPLRGIASDVVQGTIRGDVNPVGIAQNAAGRLGDSLLNKAFDKLEKAIIDNPETAAEVAALIANTTAIGSLDLAVGTLDAALIGNATAAGALGLALGTAEITIATLDAALAANTAAVIANTVAQTIGTIIPFAAGGRPPVGVPSLGGEFGPEVFIPDRRGSRLGIIGGSGPTLFTPTEPGVVVPAGKSRDMLAQARRGAGALAIPGLAQNYALPNLSGSSAALGRVSPAPAPAPGGSGGIHVTYAPTVSTVDGTGVEDLLDRHASTFIRKFDRWDRQRRRPGGNP